MFESSRKTALFLAVSLAALIVSVVAARAAAAPGNTKLGKGALASKPTGTNNTAIGFHALELDTFGDHNTAVGFDALENNTTGCCNTAVGSLSLWSNNGRNNSAVGLGALEHNTIGSDNTAVGFAALLSNDLGSSNTAIGMNANVSTGGLTNATVIGANAIVNASNKVRLGDLNVTAIEGQVAFTAVSDKTKKENFRSVDGEGVLSKIREFHLTSWNYIGHDPKEFRHYGPMAQDFFAAFGHDEIGPIGTPTTINSGDMAGILMIAVQALEKRTAENAELRARLEALERLVRERPYMQVSSNNRE